MKIASLTNAIQYNANKPNVSVLLESDFTKEIRIAFRKGQTMREHQTPFPIVVEIVIGRIDFGVNGEVHHLQTGDLISLPASVPHDLQALADSVVRLTLAKLDRAKRVVAVAEGSQ